jgi:hypothetical protein
MTNIQKIESIKAVLQDMDNLIKSAILKADTAGDYASQFSMMGIVPTEKMTRDFLQDQFNILKVQSDSSQWALSRIEAIVSTKGETN